MGTELLVPDLARRVGLSHSQLNRRFRQRYGRTVNAWIQERRMVLAKELLTSSALAPSQVARVCGVMDLQYFNKMVRRRWGVAPRALKAKDWSLEKDRLI